MLVGMHMYMYDVYIYNMYCTSHWASGVVRVYIYVCMYFKYTIACQVD